MGCVSCVSTSNINYFTHLFKCLRLSEMSDFAYYDKVYEIMIKEHNEYVVSLTNKRNFNNIYMDFIGDEDSELGIQKEVEIKPLIPTPIELMKYKEKYLEKVVDKIFNEHVLYVDSCQSDITSKSEKSLFNNDTNKYFLNQFFLSLKSKYSNLENFELLLIFLVFFTQSNSNSLHKSIHKLFKLLNNKDFIYEKHPNNLNIKLLNRLIFSYLKAITYEAVEFASKLQVDGVSGDPSEFENYYHSLFSDYNISYFISEVLGLEDKTEMVSVGFFTKNIFSVFSTPDIAINKLNTELHNKAKTTN